MSNQAIRNSDSSYYVEDLGADFLDDSLLRWNERGHVVDNSLAFVDDAGELTVPTISTGGISVSGTLEADILCAQTEVQTDLINEKTLDNGVIIDGVLVKDNDVEADEVRTDLINEKTGGSGVTIENKMNIHQQGNDMEIKLGANTSPNPTTDIHYQMVCKRDLDFHLMADVDGVASNDDPNFYMWRDANALMFRHAIENGTGIAKIQVGGDGVNPDLHLTTGVTYTAPADPGSGLISPPALSNTDPTMILDSNKDVFIPNGDLSVTGAITCTTVDTGQGANKLYAMNQDVQTTDAVTFATVNTGQGGNELYAMDQNVRTTDDVTFNKITGTGDADFRTNMVIGSDGANTAKTLNLKSLKDAILWIQSDIDDVDDTDIPSLIFSQDGQNQSSQMGILSSNDMFIRTEDVLVVYANSVNTNNGANTPPSLSTGNLCLTFDSGGVRFVGGNDVIAWGKNSTSIQHQMTASGGGTYSGAISTFNYCRVGDMVVFNGACENNSITSNRYLVSTTGFIPSDYRPANDLRFPVQVTDNGSFVFGTLVIGLNGFVSIYAGPDTGGGGDTFMGTAGVSRFSVSWIV